MHVHDTDLAFSRETGWVFLHETCGFSLAKPVYFSPDGKCGANGRENHSEDPRGKGFYCSCDSGYGGFCCDVRKYIVGVHDAFGSVD